jgi:hypothetical protein
VRSPPLVGFHYFSLKRKCLFDIRGETYRGSYQANQKTGDRYFRVAVFFTNVLMYVVPITLYIFDWVEDHKKNIKSIREVPDAVDSVYEEIILIIVSCMYVVVSISFFIYG